MQQPSTSEPNRRALQWLALFAVTAALIALSALTRLIDHDESQYVAAVALMRHGWPYLDFAYLQTPLQPLLFSPLSLLPAGWMLPGMRAANGLLGLATIGIVYAVVHRRSSWVSTMVAVAALACTHAFLLACSLARNDALPMALLAGAVAFLLRGIDRKSDRAFALAGLCLGLATSAKISAAVPAAGAALFMILRSREFGLRAVLASAAGAVVGLLPCFIFAIAAPQRFGFDVFSYSLTAPTQWWTGIGAARHLNPLYRVARLIGLAAQGSVLIAILAAALDRRRDDKLLVLDLMIVGGVIGSYMPEPAFTQYLVPLLPPLFVRFAIALDALRPKLRKPLLALTAIGSIIGLTHAARYSIVPTSGAIEVGRTPEIGRSVEALGARGLVATLSPELVAGSGVTLDPRFAAGPFLYRTYGRLGDNVETYGRAVGWQDLDRVLDGRPPAVVLVGDESRPHRPLFPHGLDQPMQQWAASRGYRPVPLSDGLTAYVAPPRPSRSSGSPNTRPTRSSA